ncbi:MAG: thioredoxin domain-containing protein [Flavobacteriales bacterium]
MKIKYILLFFPLTLLMAKCQEKKSMTEKHTPEYTNKLINESSPYLLQHAHNPVEWYPWGDEAFEKAEKENKLVLISIGYSACHWCHVMEHESFEDSLTAEMMNKNFINIKVDREERPDVDQVYMNAVQLMTGSGGWPLNCFALPDGRPVYGGTYFPKDKWQQTLTSLQGLKENDPIKLEEYAKNLTAGIQQSELITRNEDPLETKVEFLAQKVNEWSKYWDRKKGGPNRAPKFPLPNNYQFLLEYAFLSGDQESMDFVSTTLDQMARGGIYDQIGGGFARYSTDELWKAPHFEKMLYDNAQLVSLYSQAFTATQNPRYKKIVQETLAFIKRELTNKNGGFYSALDADSEGEEGKFYVWKKEELKEALTPEEFELAKDFYNVNNKGLWEHGNYILLMDENSDDMLTEDSTLGNKLELIKSKLLARRETRIRPGLDDKILTSWNMLMIEAYLDAYIALEDEQYLNVAEQQMKFIFTNLITEDEGLFHLHKDGKSSINGYLEDYAFTISALLKMYQSTFDESYISQAESLMHYTVKHFLDEESGMFWFKSNKDEQLIAKKQENSDNVIPASNSVMAHNLFILSKLTYNQEFAKTGKQMLSNILPHIEYGQSYSNWLRLYLYETYPFYEIAATGKNFRALTIELRKTYIPNKLILGAEKKSDLPLLENKFFEEETIFVCQNKTCQLPVKLVTDALKQIN